MDKLKIAYFGTPYFSARFLEKIIIDEEFKKMIEVKFVVTQPDAKVSRKQLFAKSPVKIIAEKYGIEVFDSQIRNSHFVIQKLKNLDGALLFAYGNIVPNELLSLPKLGFLNTHPSLLPKYRGASPMVYPLILGDKKTGVTLIKLDEQIDHGPIIAQEELQINLTDKRPDLEIKLTDLAFKLLKKTIKELIKNPTSLKLRRTRQNENEATYTKLLTKEDGFIPIEVLRKALNDEYLRPEELPVLIKNYKLKTKNSSEVIFNYFRGLFSWPGIWTLLRPEQIGTSDGQAKFNKPKRLRIIDMELLNNKLVFKKVQLEGKKEVDFKTFNNAYKTFQNVTS